MEVITLEVNIGNKTIVPIQLDNHELAWAIEEVSIVFEYLKSISAIVLGGDVLNENQEYTYDNWFYSSDYNCDNIVNSERSINLAINYISNYISLNGNAFYVVIVTQDDVFK